MTRRPEKPSESEFRAARERAIRAKGLLSVLRALARAKGEGDVDLDFWSGVDVMVTEALEDVEALDEIAERLFWPIEERSSADERDHQPRPVPPLRIVGDAVSADDGGAR